jgi:MscS family membrane protein
MENAPIYRQRLEDTMDFSATYKGHLADEQVRRMVYLKEILDRLPPPQWDAIPGPAEVESQNIEHWTIPDTNISIVRITEGDRQGDYLFSASSVARLHQDYQRIEHIPYRDSIAPKLYKSVMDYLDSGRSVATRVRHKLEQVDLSSPQRLVQVFLEEVNQAHIIIDLADKAAQTPGSKYTREDAVKAEKLARQHFDRAAEALDLSEVPAATRTDVSTETVLLIKEILDRTPLPPLATIPGTKVVQALRIAGEKPIRWVFPNTNLEIVEVLEGPRAGQFQFSAAAVEQAEESFQKVEKLAYRGTGEAEDVQLRSMDDYAPGSTNVTKTFYHYYIDTPGQLIPSATILWPVLKHLPDSLKQRLGGQTLWQWLGLLLGGLLILLVFLIMTEAGRWSRKHLPGYLHNWSMVAHPIVNLLVILAVEGFADQVLNITGKVNTATVIVADFSVLVFAASALYRLSAAVSDTIVHFSKRDDQDFDSSLLRVAARAVGFLVGTAIVVNGVRSLGLDLLPLIAGLGVGGLAVALAIRPTLENMIGGIILYADRPVQIGDHCQFGSTTGKVERIGLRSTRIRAKNRTLITIPNSVFANMQITNWALCDTMLIETVIGLRCETSPDQLRHVMARMRQTCFAHPMIESNSLRIRFTGFGASSLDVSVRVYARTSDWNEFYAVREDLFLRFADIIEESGTSVALPASTVYVGQDEALDPEAAARAEQQVHKWREAEELPFPITPEPLAARLEDTLDYPPKGSPMHKGT